MGGKRMNLALNTLYRAEIGKKPTPSTFVVDTQTVAVTIQIPHTQSGRNRKIGF
jgi:hypothetical protein